MVLEFIYAEMGIDVVSDRVGVARTSVYFGGWKLSIEEQQEMRDLALDVCKYIFEYNSKRDDGQRKGLQDIYFKVFNFYDDIKSGVMNESIWDEKPDDKHTHVYVHNSD